jgi:hypothetical protein
MRLAAVTADDTPLDSRKIATLKAANKIDILFFIPPPFVSCLYNRTS